MRAIGENPLAEIDRQITQQKAEAVRVAREHAEKVVSDSAIAKIGMTQFEKIRTELFSKIRSFASNVRIGANDIHFGGARLLMSASTNPEALNIGRWSCLATGTISVLPVVGRSAWEASLWYVREGATTETYWLQMSFMDNPLTPDGRMGPFAASPNSKQAQQSFMKMMGVAQLAENPKKVTTEDVAWFEDLWIGRLALAAKGELRFPNTMPFEQISREYH